MKTYFLSILILYFPSFCWSQCEPEILFLEDENIELTPFNFGTLNETDIDNDGDMDILLVRGSSGVDFPTVVYKNDGFGNFETIHDHGIGEGLFPLAVEFGDVDGDGDSDLIMAGVIEASVVRTRLYLNDGTGFFTEDEDAEIQDLYNADLMFVDIDGDDDLDLVGCGLSVDYIHTTYIYENDGYGNFVEIQQLTGVMLGFLAHGDVDGDGDDDLFVSGSLNDGAGSDATLYLNNGDGNYSSDENNDFFDAIWGEAKFGDFDGDSDLDLIYCGRSDGEDITVLYTNDGEGNFQLSGQQFLGSHYGTLDAMDLDSDSDLDIIITGGDSLNEVGAIYSNDGTGNFTEISDNGLRPTTHSAVVVADFDGDGKMDAVIGGLTQEDPYVINIPEQETVYYSNVSTGIAGCTDEVACNYSNFADCDDESCVYIEIFDLEGDQTVMQSGLNTYSYPGEVDNTFEWTVENGVILSGQGTNQIEVQWNENAQDGELCVTEVGPDGCQGQEVCLTLSVVVNIGESIKLTSVVYPNPSSGTLYISNPHQIVEFKVFDLTGRIVVASTGQFNQIELPQGSYVFELTDHFNRSSIQQVIVR